MTKEKFEEFTKSLFSKMSNVLRDKNNDYTEMSTDAFANFEQARDYGVDPLIGLCVRMGDKIKRVQTFCKTKSLAVEDEHVEDAFEDIIGYCTIALAMIKEKKDNHIDYP